MTVLITLTTAGLDAGPFDLYSNVDGYSVPFETGVSKLALLAGYTSTLVTDNTITVRVRSTGVCTNYIDIPIGGITTTTTSTSNPCANCVAHDVTIGPQIWTGCNLDVTTYRNGDTIPQVTDPNGWAMLSIGAWCYYENNSANGATYGKLYNIYAILDPRGIAPVGYHVPNNTEWTTLTATLGGGTWIDAYGDGGSFFQPEIGSALAEANGCHWMPGFLNPTNSSGFTALPGGGRATAGYFGSLQGEAIFASSTLVNNTPGIEQIWGHTINNIFTGIDRSWVSPSQGISVRLIKD
jgi:uncharacterized protein (TIGR02145 family)